MSTQQQHSGPHYSTVEFEDEPDLPVGTRIADGRIEVLGPLARGGVGVVYRALDHESGRTVALKIATKKATSTNTEARFRNEARLGASLAGHPSVVPVLAVGQLEQPDNFAGRMWIMTELVRGRSLDEHLRKHRTGLGIPRACRIAQDIANALVVLHERGIVHRDVKPGNIMLEEGTERARILDFGLAFATGDGWEERSPDLTAADVAPGTPIYMSPQQALGERPSAAFDIYALGVLIYELVSGDPPYEGLPKGHIIARKCDPTARPYPLRRMCPKTPLALGELVQQCMSFEPSNRPSATEVVAALDGLVAPHVVPLHVVSMPTSAETPADLSEGATDPETEPRRRGAVWIFAAVVFLLLGLLCIAAWIHFAGATIASPQRTQVAPVPRVQGTIEAPYVGSTTAPSGTSGGAAASAVPLAEPHVDAEGTDDSETTTDGTTDGGAHGPKARRPPKTKRRTLPVPVTCEQRRAAAKRAQAQRQWRRVLEQTDERECWPDNSARAQLRVRALMELQRYKACTKEAFSSKDPTVIEWGRDCHRKATAPQ